MIFRLRSATLSCCGLCLIGLLHVRKDFENIICGNKRAYLDFGCATGKQKFVCSRIIAPFARLFEKIP